MESLFVEIYNRLGYNTIAHHGIKGQKRGVRNEPPYPLDKSQKSDIIIKKESQIRDRNGNWTHQERIDNNERIGSYVDRKTMKETKTSKGIIVYSKTGTHIYPAKDERSFDD